MASKMNAERKIQFARTCLFILFFVHSSYANNFNKNQMGIGVGISQYASRDYLVSPLVYSGWGIPFISRWIAYDRNKVSFEGIGIAPDIPVQITEADSIAGRDTILENAILLIQQQTVQ